tara:strand:+ start:478 stop:927 length:450 start_codon:yes stop_codon:yes gene_type:complete
MKGELSEQQEKFCQKYTLLGNASGSAKEAGYASASAKVSGHKLLQMPKVIERIEELRNEMSTSYDVVAELEGQYAYAKSHGHTNSALKALEMLSKIRGNKAAEINHSEEAIHASLVGSFYVLGRKTVMGLMSEAEALGSQAVVNANQYK